MFSSLFCALLITQSILMIHGDDCSDTICNPRAGDLLIGRENLLSASSTCGLRGPEFYCVVTGNDQRSKKCSMCDSQNPYDETFAPESHQIQNVVSRQPRDNKRWWQSEVNKDYVTIQVNFETEFQFASTDLRFKTYRPKKMLIMRSQDYGVSWRPYAYFSDNCARDFPTVSRKPRLLLNDVNCISKYSSISPSEGGFVKFAVNPNSSVVDENKSYLNKEANDATAITNLKITFSKLHKFGDSIIGSTNEINAKYYYALYEWVVIGRCSCYGHADKCVPMQGQVPTKIQIYGICECQHNTDGKHCEKCKDFYNDQPWRPAERNKNNECKPCNCNQHSKSCYFSPIVYQQTNYKSGGFCNKCEHNTEGKNCERCQGGYYRNVNVGITAINTCLKCNCNQQGSLHQDLCIQEANSRNQFKPGQCICKENVAGFNCDSCIVGYYDFIGGCKKCNCKMIGTLNNDGCNKLTGTCACKRNVEGIKCDKCKSGFFNLISTNPDGCTFCGCSIYGSINPSICHPNSGQCQCKQGYSGRTCAEVKDGWYVNKKSIALSKNEASVFVLPPVKITDLYNIRIVFNTSKVSDTGVIQMYFNVTNVPAHKKCQPYKTYFAITKEENILVLPNVCLDADLPIKIQLAVANVIDSNVEAFQVQEIVVSPMFDRNPMKTRRTIIDCLKDFKSTDLCKFIDSEIITQLKPKSDPKKCNCDVTGSVTYICEKFDGQCKCRPNVDGKRCDTCASQSYGFSATGCKKCSCHMYGSLNLDCHPLSGNCLCKSGVTGKRCNDCKVGYWSFPNCIPCQCNSLAKSCDQKDGKCIDCEKNSFGFNCQQCKKGYYGNPKEDIKCLKCRCPDLGLGLDHSAGCNLVQYTNKFRCRCKRGYIGENCEKCDVNYYGNPTEKDGQCKPCDCSGNIDLTVPENCDPSSGKCLKCIYNTAGFNCEKCAEGFYGDGAKGSCKKCTCNSLGTNKNGVLCNSRSGQCNCLPNVIGKSCDHCKDGYYNLISGKGCQPCDCSFPDGSKSEFCDKITGQCDCYKTRSGRKCDQCPDKHWGFIGKLGCKQCMCNSSGSETEQCDRSNGDCQCKKGVVGHNCDRCGPGTFGKLPNCMPCGECWQDWMNKINKIAQNNNELMKRLLLPGNQSMSSDFMKLIQILDKINLISANIKHAETAVDFYNNTTMQKFPDFDLAGFLKRDVVKTLMNEFDAIINKLLNQSSSDYKFQLTELTRIYQNLILQKFEIDKFAKNNKNILKNAEALKQSVQNRTINETLIAYRFLSDLVTKNEKDIEIFKGLICSNADTCNKDACDLNKCGTKDTVTYPNFLSIINQIEAKLKIIQKPIPNMDEDKQNYNKTQNTIDDYNKQIEALKKTVNSQLEEVKNMDRLIKSWSGDDDFKKAIEKIEDFKYDHTVKELQEKFDAILDALQKLNNVDVIIDENRKILKEIKEFLIKIAFLKKKFDTKVILELFKSVSLTHGKVNEIYEKLKEKYNDKKRLEELERKQANSTALVAEIKRTKVEIDAIRKEVENAWLKQLTDSIEQRKQIDTMLEKYKNLKSRADRLPKTQKEFDDQWQEKFDELNKKKKLFEDEILKTQDEMKKSEKQIDDILKEYEEVYNNREKKTEEIKELQLSIMKRTNYQSNCMV